MDRNFSIWTGVLSVRPLLIHAILRSVNSTTTDRTQRGRILGLLIANRGSAVPLLEILKLNIAQYNARIFELRRLGFSIQNFQEGGHSFFRLVPGPTPAPAPITPACQDSLFPELTPRHTDNG